MNTYPYRWVILKIAADDRPLYRVFAMWSGGYLDGDSWRINSGVTRVEETDDAFLFHGLSGSIYECAKGAYGLTAYGSAVISQWLADGVQVMPEDTDWVALFE
jgi:hypothetical protein